MAGLYTPEQLGIATPQGGFQQGGWYESRQYWDGMLSDPGVINPKSNQVGAGQAVSNEVNAASAAQQGVSSQQFNDYIKSQQQKSANIQPQATYNPGGFSQAQGLTVGDQSGAMSAFQPATQSAFNLPELYKSLYSDSGIKDLESKYSDMERAFIDAKASINDNPFLSEADRVGRVEKLTQQFNERTANVKNDIATKKADIETQINLQTKQFDINSQQTQMAWNQFNTLLEMGALNNISAEGIASITRATGITSDMIYSAIQAKQKKDINPQVIQSTADSGEVTVSVIDANTGELIKQTSLGKIGNAQQGAKATESEMKSYYMGMLRQDAGNGVTLQDILKIYSGYLDPNEIYQLYNANSIYGPAQEDTATLSKYGIKTQEAII